MNAATLTRRTDDQGRPYLSGTLNYDLSRGAIVLLKKVDDGEYALIAASGDGRTPNNTRESLGSFVLVDEITPTEDLSETEFIPTDAKRKRGR